ncbi:unnamed protein product [Camellia sinensis]
MAIMITSSLSLLASSPFISLLFVLVFAIDGQEFTIKEATIDGIQRAFTENRLTSRQLVDFYLHQIETLNPVLRGVIEVNPDAVDQAEEADRERERNQGRRFLGDLHGVPVLLKDSIGTKDKLNTTVGSYALLGSVVARDATVVERLRKAGAVIMGKASVSEWYGFRSLSIPEGWCARSGQGLNPYVLSGNTCGSSSGSAISVAANMVSVSLGTETDGSIICPADYNSVVGIKPTVGLTSRAGVVSMSPRQDTIGTVSDAVHVLDAIVGFDPRDFEATKEAATFIPAGGYKQFLNKDGLKGKRLGVVRNPFLALLNRSKAVATFEHHLYTLRQSGATIVDNLEITNVDVILDPYQSGEAVVMLAEFKLAINDYLKELITSPVRSLSDVITFNMNYTDLEKTEEYGQEIFYAAEFTNGLGEEERMAIEAIENLSRDGIEKLMKENKLDAMVTPGSGASPVLAIGGYPAISVPAGYDSDGMPFGICFGGLKGTEPKLIEIAYGFEQATMELHFCDLTLPLFNILYVRKNISNEEVTVIYDPASSVLPKTFISLVIITGLVLTMNGQEFTIEEATTREIQQAFADTERNRGAESGPDARDLADEADRERQSNGGSLGDLHGIPLLVKDTIGTKDKMNTTAGSYALIGSEVARDAGVVERQRKAGAVMLGKASLSEWYRIRSINGVPNGWCARSGQGVNPYVPSGSPCRSSSGYVISVAANMVAVSLGTETHNFIICPSDHNSVVGLKPTIGLTSRAAVIPYAPRWDTIGPICRTVEDAVYVLDVIAGFDPRDDEATREGFKFIPEGLKGKRLGVDHLSTLRKRGAIVVDNLHIANIDEILDPHRSGELMVMATDFKISINAYLKELITSPVRSLTCIITFNQNNPELEKLAEYGQQTFIEAEESTGIGYPAITAPAGYDSDGMPFGIFFGGLRGTELKLN